MFASNPYQRPNRSADLRLIPHDNQFAGSLLVTVNDESSKRPQGFASRQNQEPFAVPVELSLTGDQRSKEMQEGIIVDLAAQGKTHKVRVIVLDRNLQNTGQ
jgi:hypothetical protein